MIETSRRYLAGAVAATVLFSGACTSGDPELPSIPSATEVADDLLSAWEQRDAKGLEEYARPLEVRGLLAAIEDAFVDGAIISMEVETTGRIVQPTPVEPSPSAPATTSVPFTITWSSEASATPASFDGEIPLEYDFDSRRWSATLERGSLWPGRPDAHGFDVTYRWLKRAPIVDRKGRTLAKGRAAKRSYPQGTLAGSVIGHIGSLTKEDIDADAVGERGDLVGGSGMERLFQERLAGEPEMKLDLVDVSGHSVEELGRVPGTRGKKVRSTLDVDVQRAAQAAYGSSLGGAVVLDPATGDVLAVADAAPFGPVNYVGAKDVEPFNRALSGRYPPGSAMKVATAGAALDTGTVTARTTVTGPQEYKGVRNFESGRFGSIPFATAVKFSVNTAFAQVAEKLGAAKLTRYAERFGFNEAPRIEAATSSFPRPEDLGDLMWSSVGQAQVLATPLTMASVAATVANDGKRMEPRLAKHQPKRGTRVLKRKHAATLASMMESVVEGGTGTGARIPGVRVAGKTGTAEVDVGGERRNHAWFVSFAPVGDPKVAVAAVVELGGIGGQVAAPLVRRILNAVLGLV